LHDGQAARSCLRRIGPDHPDECAQAGQQFLMVADPVQGRLDPAHHLTDLALKVFITGAG